LHSIHPATVRYVPNLGDHRYQQGLQEFPYNIPEGLDASQPLRPWLPPELRHLQDSLEGKNTGFGEDPYRPVQPEKKMSRKNSGMGEMKGRKENLADDNAPDSPKGPKKGLKAPVRMDVKKDDRRSRINTIDKYAQALKNSKAVQVDTTNMTTPQQVIKQLKRVALRLLFLVFKAIISKKYGIISIAG
jgi:hypothetical protein